jgi:hypothetical protein
VSAGILVAAAAALLAGVGMIVTGRLLALGAWRTWIGAVAGAVLAGLVVADFVVSGAGTWWAEHPNAAATATGLLLLALTVLVVEAAVERVLRASEAQRWRAAAAVAATAVLNNAVNPLQRLASELDGISNLGRVRKRSGNEWPPHSVVSLRSGAPRTRAELERAVLAAAPVLTATDDLHRLYDRALAAVEAAAAIDEAVMDWWRALQGTGTEGVESPEVSDEVWRQQCPDGVDAWRHVRQLWTMVLSQMGLFEREAVEGLSVDAPSLSPWQAEPSS